MVKRKKFKDMRVQNNMDKRGLSDVVTTVLIILLVIVAVLIVWMFVKPFIFNSTSKINPTIFTTAVEISPSSFKQSQYPNGQKYFEFVVNRKAGEGNLIAGLVTFTDSKRNVAVQRVEFNPPLQELEGRKVIVNYTEGSFIINGERLEDLDRGIEFFAIVTGITEGNEEKEDVTLPVYVKIPIIGY